MTSGARLKRLREKLGITQQLLSQATGIQVPNISHLESGRKKLTKNMEQRIRRALARLRRGELHVVSRLALHQAQAILSGRGK